MIKNGNEMKKKYNSARAEKLNLNDVIDRFAAQRPKSRIMLA